MEKINWDDPIIRIDGKKIYYKKEFQTILEVEGKTDYYAVYLLDPVCFYRDYNRFISQKNEITLADFIELVKKNGVKVPNGAVIVKNDIMLDGYLIWKTTIKE